MYLYKQLNKMIVFFICLILAIVSTTPSLATDSVKNPDSTQITVFGKEYSVFFTDNGNCENFPQQKIVEFLEVTPSRGTTENPFTWDDYTFQWNGDDFFAFASFCNATFQRQPSPNFSVEGYEDYIRNFISQVILVEVPNAPNVVQQWTAAVLFIHSNHSDQPLEYTYYESGRYDKRTFSVNSSVDERISDNVSIILEQYLDGYIDVPPYLDCQSKYFWGNLLMAWLHPENDTTPEEYQYFSTGKQVNLEGYIE